MNLGEQETLITVALPEATRANSANSAVGALDNNVLENYDLRFILEIYQGNKCYRMESIGQETEATFPVRVVQGHEYDFVVWADFVAKDAVELAENDIFYNTNEGDCGLQNITILNNAAMTEARDAYYGVAHLDADKAVSTISNITLTRPFAKVRVITTDLSDCIEKLGLQPSTATVTYTTETYDKFDARNKNVWSVNSNDNVKSINYDPSTRVYSEDNLFVDYILVPQGTQSTVKFDLNVTDVINRSFNTDIAVEANKITTIKGNILTNGSDITVDVNDDFVSETIYLEGDVTLTENLTIDRPMVVRAGAKAVLNLNGHTITADLKQEGRHHYAIDNYGTLTLEGEGAINARGIENFGTMTINGNITITNVDTNGGSAIWNEGNLVINGGTFTTNAEAGVGSYGSALNTQEGGSAVIDGGNFIANSQLTYAILNYGETVINNATVKGKHGAVASASGAAYKTTINGGSFELMENPGVSDHCAYYVSEIKGGKFTLGTNTDNGAQVFYASTIAEGYVSVADGDWFKVIYDPYYGYTKVSNAKGLNEALADSAVEKILLQEGEYGTIVAKSNKTIVGTPEAKVDAVNLFGADNLTLKNINFDAAKAIDGYDNNGAHKAHANIVTGDNTNKADKGAHNLVIDGCTFTGTFANGGEPISFTDYNRTSGYSGNITIKNCVFDTIGAYYDIYAFYTGDSLNGHGDFVIEGNTFKTASYAAGPIYLGRYASSTPVVLKNNVFEVITSVDDAIYVQDHGDPNSNYNACYTAEGNTFAE